MVLGTVLALSSCDKVDGPTYTPDATKVSFLKSSGNFAMANGVIEIPVDRPSIGIDLSVPVTLTVAEVDKPYLDVFSANDPIVFAAGEDKSFARIKYTDYSKLNPSALAITPVGMDVKVGLAFPLVLNISSANIAPRDVQKINVLASSNVEFEDKGTIEIDSRGGWAEKMVTGVKIQKAKGSNVYKLISPYGVNSIAFMIKPDGKTITFPDQAMAKDPDYGVVTMKGVKGTVVDNVVTLTVDSYAVSAGSFGSGKEIFTLPN